jgi:hypothetical protein
MAVVISNVLPMTDGWLLQVVGLHPNEMASHYVWIPTGAIADRVAAYALPQTLAGRRRAVAAILREHRWRLAREDIDPATISVTGVW